MPILDKTFSIHDGTIGIWREHLGDPTKKVDWLYEKDWETHESIRMLMVRDGFSFHQDRESSKHYPSLRKYMHCGQKQDLHFKSYISGRHHGIKFFENVIRDNPNGGQYTSDKLAKMPYQLRKKTELALGKITKHLLSLGFTDTTKRTPALAIDRCMLQREALGLFQGERFYANPPCDYNSRDHDGKLLRDGQIRYFWDYYGRLGRGVVFHNINNMWWVIASPYTLLNIASFDFFDWKPGMPLKNPHVRKNKLEKRLKKAVEAQDFEHAIIFRNLLKEAA